MSRPQPPSGDREALDQALSALVDGLLSAPEEAALEAVLLEDRAARDAFRDFMRTECLLRWEAGYGDDDATAPKQAAALPRWGHAAAWLVPLTLVALWLVAGGWIVGKSPPPTPPSAKLTDVTNAAWLGTRPLDPGAAMPPGPVRLVAGSAQVTFASGAVVVLNAPAEIEVLGPNRVFLRDGRITPFVPESAKGFTVVSPSSEVIDFGTEFSIGVDADGHTDVYVIDGEVDVRRSLARPAAPVRMTQGYGVRLAVGDGLPTRIFQPLVVDHFDGAPDGLSRLDVGAASQDIRSIVRDGSLCIPFVPRDRLTQPTFAVVLDQTSAGLRGRCSKIAFKATTSQMHDDRVSGWVGLILDDCRGTPSDATPAAWESTAAAAVLVSSTWQAGVRIDGEAAGTSRVYARNEDAVGPYQVVVAIDDSPHSHAVHGGTTLTVAVNGLEVVRDRRFILPDSPRLSLQTFRSGAASTGEHARIDDFSVSAEIHDESNGQSQVNGDTFLEE